jgi:hypothetical protein
MIQHVSANIVQAKIERKLKSTSDYDAVEEDFADMLHRSDASHMRLYEDNGVRAVNA